MLSIIKRNKTVRILTIIFVSMLILTAATLIFYVTVRESGKKNLTGEWENMVPEPILSESEPEELTEAEKEKWQAGWVKYNGEIYEYNRDVLTFLVMGIDETAKQASAVEGTGGGHADALFLIVLNPTDQSVKMVSINRNTMADVDLYNPEGTYMDTVKAQITVQHGFGDGKEESCEYQVNAVRRLFYNIPVHGYCALNMEAVITLVDLVGGIELTALEDVRLPLPEPQDGWRTVKKGEQLSLDGRGAYSYVQFRDVTLPESANGRLERQKQFLNVFIQKVKEAVKEDLTVPVKFYDAIAGQMVTDVTADEVVYMASEIPVNSLGFDTLSLSGETVRGEEFEEYYLDEDALYQTIIDVFYQPVENLP